MTTNMSTYEMTPVSLPVGYKFHPTEEELVNYYLKKKVRGANESVIDQIIPCIDLYEHEPTELPGLLRNGTNDDDREWFFFTRRNFKYNKSSRSNRSTKKGYWKITGKERGIKARRSKAVIGKKRTLTFYEGRGSKAKRISWVIHEHYLPPDEVVLCSKQTKGDFVICRLKDKSDKKDSSVSNEVEPSFVTVSISENQASDEINQEVQENGELLLHPDECCSSALWSPAPQELEDVLQTNGTNDDCNELQSPVGDSASCLPDRNEVSTCDEDEASYDLCLQLRDPPEKNLDSLFGRPQARDYCPSKLHSPIYAKLGDIQHPLQSENYQPLVTLQPPMYIEQGNTPDASLYYDECNNWQSAFKNNISTNEFDMRVQQITYTFENQATDYRILKVPQPQTEVNLESAACRLQPQDCTLQPPIYTNFGEALHNIECNELQYSSWENDCSLTKFMNTNFQDCYSYDQAAQTHNLQSHWEGSTIGIVE
ncbi:NAC domain-containing protein 2-like [Argentina anserina]|uniref:NAC domain-containing protein 2-like n=1 Tax=Argentina anserina TaxID=57926 RepID=UPI0021766F75|nr:NAC domain-containing protein 2-like [Potentilla anserina]